MVYKSLNEMTTARLIEVRRAADRDYLSPGESGLWPDDDQCRGLIFRITGNVEPIIL